MSGELVIDVSSNNHAGVSNPLPWEQIVAAGVKGIVVKVTQGTDYVNPFADQDIAEAKAHGLGVSVYHFFEPSTDANEIQAQANFFRANDQGAKMLWVDVEVDNGLTLAQVGIAAREMLISVAAVPAPYPMSGLYCDLNYYSLMAGAPWGHPQWIAEPSSPVPTVPAFLHQFGQTQIAGASFDINRWYGTDEQFAALFDLGAPPAPAPIPVPSAPVSEGEFMPPTLKQGDLNGSVKSLQRLLQGSSPHLVVDGDFGPETETAVMDIQRFFGLAVDGIVGPKTWTILDTFG